MHPKMGLLRLLLSLGVLLVIATVPPIEAVFENEGAEDSLLAHTTVGTIRGFRDDDGTAMFLGIPFAQVNKDNPFGATTPYPVFENIFDAFNDSARCPQMQEMASTTLDCLQLNVYVPKTTAQKPLPVMVYIHGGGFNSGGSERYNLTVPKFFIRHDVIFVSLNYRLGVYGFMCLHTSTVPGNQGLKDQLNALRWIKKNIAAFGGDDENITIDGDSAGGVSVDLQLLFADEGLFHKVITQSGTSLGPWAVQEPDINAPFKIANRLGFETTDLDEAMSFLSKQSSNEIIFTAAVLQLSFGPCLEKKFPNVDGFITTHPVNTPIRNAEKIPLMAGYNADEMWMTFAHMPPSALENSNTFNSLHNGFDFGEKYDIMQSIVRRFYIADEPMGAEVRRPLCDFQSDFTFAHPTQRSIGKYLEHNGTVYHYVFSYIGGRNLLRRRMNITTGGAVHADEIGYMFDLPDMQETPSPEDQLIIDRMTTLWTNFVKYGNPTPSATTLLPDLWPPVTPGRLTYLDLNTPLSLKVRPFRERLAFWDFFYAANRNYVRGFEPPTA